jgi:hypothetical protein
MLGSYVIGVGGAYAVERMNFTPGSLEALKPWPVASPARRWAMRTSDAEETEC